MDIIVFIHANNSQTKMQNANNTNNTANNTANNSEQSPSICIPWMYTNISKERVIRTFESLDGFARGCIERVDMITKTNAEGRKNNVVFIHFKFWPKTKGARYIRDELLQGNEVRIVYQEPWFWKCVRSNVEKPPVRKEFKKPYVQTTKVEPHSKPAENSNASSVKTGKKVYRKKHQDQQSYVDTTNNKLTLDEWEKKKTASTASSSQDNDANKRTVNEPANCTKLEKGKEEEYC